MLEPRAGGPAPEREDCDEALRHITQMFLAGLAGYSDAQIAEFGTSFGRLVDMVETPARAELSRQFAPLERAPERVVRRLARDEDIEVAGPVLSESPALAAADLVRIAASRGQDHLRAISVRPNLEAAVTDVLLDRGDDTVARTVAANAGASFSFRGFASLIRRAERNDDLAEAVGTRADLPPAVLRAVLSYASEEARQRICDADPQVKARIDALARRHDAPAAPPCDLSAARALVEPMHRAGALTAAAILGFAVQRRIEPVIVALGLLCAVPYNLIDQLLRIDRGEVRFVPCKAANLPWPTAAEVLRVSAADRSLSEPALDRLFGLYARLTTPNAQTLMRFWLVQGSLQSKRPAPLGAEPVRNRRRGTRRTVDLPGAVLAPSGALIARCTILDVSNGGARIALADHAPLPATVVLVMAGEARVRRTCEVRWQARNLAGLLFATTTH